MMTNNDGVMFNGSGPIMTGTWVNPKTGDSFTVRDSFFENNQLLVQTTDGRYLDYNKLQNYVQSNKQSDVELLKNAGNNNLDNKTNEELPPEVASLIDDGNDTDILPEDLTLISGNPRQTSVSLGNLNKPASHEVMNETDQNKIIIKKALSKSPMPKFDFNIKWSKEFPKQEIELLLNIMDISMEEIISYYIDNIDVDEIANSVSKAISNEIINKIKPESKEKPMTIEEPVKPVKKTTTKKTTKK